MYIIKRSVCYLRANKYLIIKRLIFIAVTNPINTIQQFCTPARILSVESSNVFVPEINTYLYEVVPSALHTDMLTYHKLHFNLISYLGSKHRVNIYITIAYSFIIRVWQIGLRYCLDQ